MKKEGNHKRAQKSAKRSKSGVVQKRWDTRGKEKRRKKKSQKLGLLLLLWVPQKVSKIFKKKKTKILSLGFSPLKLKRDDLDDSDKSEQKAASNKREREREDGTAA